MFHFICGGEFISIINAAFYSILSAWSEKKYIKCLIPSLLLLVKLRELLQELIELLEAVSFSLELMQEKLKFCV